jgi:hypothetical protein
MQGGVFESNSVSVDWAGELEWSGKSHGKRHSHEYMVLLFPQQNQSRIVEFYGWCADISMIF